MIVGDLGGLKLPDICLTGEEKPWKNLTQETCPNRGSNPGPLRDKRAYYHLLHSGGHVTKQLIIFQYGWWSVFYTPVKIVKHKRGKPFKISEKTIVLNVLNKFKRIYEFRFKKIRYPNTSKRTRHRSIVTVLGTCMCHKHLALMAEGYLTQFLFTLANHRLTKAHGFIDIRIVVPLNLV